MGKTFRVWASGSSKGRNEYKKLLKHRQRHNFRELARNYDNDSCDTMNTKCYDDFGINGKGWHPSFRAKVNSLVRKEKLTIPSDYSVRINPTNDNRLLIISHKTRH